MAKKPNLRDYYNEVLFAKVVTIVVFFMIAMAIFVFVFDPPEELVVIILMIYGGYMYGLVREKAVVGDYSLPDAETAESNQLLEAVPSDKDKSSGNGA